MQSSNSSSTSASSRLEVGATRLHLGHSLRVAPGAAAPSASAPLPRSDLSARLRAFLPALAAANEELAERVAREGAAAVDIQVLAQPARGDGDDEDVERDEAGEDDADESDEDDEDDEDEEEEVDEGAPRHIEMNISIHELLPGHEHDELEADVAGDAAGRRKRPPLIEEVGVGAGAGAGDGDGEGSDSDDGDGSDDVAGPESSGGPDGVSAGKGGWITDPRELQSIRREVAEAVRAQLGRDAPAQAPPR